MAKPVTTTKTTVYDYDHNGSPDSIVLHSETTDRKGNVILVEDKYDWNGNGAWESTSVTENSYNSRNQLTSSETRSDNDGNGTIDQIVEHNINYVKKAGMWLPSQERWEYDWDGNGDSDYMSGVNNTYNNNGLLTKSVNIYDWDGNGRVDQKDVTTYKYNGDGDVVSERVDLLNDGNIDIVTTYDYDIA